MVSYALAVADEVIGEEPENFKQAMKNKDKLKWPTAMQKEISLLKKNNTWVLVKKH